MEGKRPTDSAVETTHLVLPSDTNALGTAFGGQIMAWMDIAAAVAAGRHCRGTSVTAAIDDVHFAQPIRLGDVVIIKSCVNFTGRTSMEVGVRVEREDHKGFRTHCLSAYFTFVCVDPNGAPRGVPPIVPVTDVERKRFEAAQNRRERRLALRQTQ